MEEIKIAVLPFECIDGKTSVAQIRIRNTSKNIVRLDGDGFIFKGLYDMEGKSINPNVLYDPVKEMTKEIYSIDSGEEKTVSISFNDMQYFELRDEKVEIEFEYSNLIKKSDGIIRGTIPINRIVAKVCKR